MRAISFGGWRGTSMIDKRKSSEPILVGLNIRISEEEVAMLDRWLLKRPALTRSSGARLLLRKILREELET